MTPAPPDRLGDALRLLILLALVAGPLAFGAVHEPAFIPLIVVSLVVGASSWLRGHYSRTLGGDVPEIPLGRLLLAFHVLVLVQLVPLPPFLLRLLSPGSYAHHHALLLVPRPHWATISTSPADTWRGLAFLIAFSLLFGAVFREFHDERWRRRLAHAVVGVGLVMTVVGLVQAAQKLTRIYGLWQPAYDWAVFGPYVNRSHFAGYIVMAIPLAAAFALEALAELRRDWRRRRRGWLALGGPAGNALARRTAEAMVLVVGLVASQSRGGFVAFAGSMVAFPLASRHRRLALVVVAVVLLIGIPWIGLGDIIRGFQSRGIQGSRVDLWRDMAPMFWSFPVFGAGFAAFGSAYARFQGIWRDLFIGEAHNDYLQVIFDTGLIGAGLFAAALLGLFRAAFGAARKSAFGVGLLGSLLGLAVHALVDFNWQIPGNAATYAALAALAFREGPHLESPRPTRT